MQSSKLQKYQVFYQNETEYHQLKREIFHQGVYYFETHNPLPYIIDAGAHIGLATLYFKSLFPMARILAIEPNPITRECLETLVFDNNLTDVSIGNFALGTQDGTQTFVLPENNTGWHMAAGLNLSPELLEPTRRIPIEVKTLSSLLDQPVDLLKLDIEGMESQVLHEAKDKLSLVKELLIEFHPKASNTWQDFSKFLTNMGFTRIERTDKPGQMPPKDMAVIKAARK